MAQNKLSYLHDLSHGLITSYLSIGKQNSHSLRIFYFYESKQDGDSQILEQHYCFFIVTTCQMLRLLS